MLFHELRHIKAYHALLIAENRFGKRLSQLSLSHSGLPEEQKRAGRALRLFKPRSPAADRIRDQLYRLILTYHAPAELLLKPGEPRSFVLRELLRRDTSHRRGGACDVLPVD